jgi:hypothetical protein
MRLPTRSHRPVMFSLSGMSSLSSMGKVAWVQTPHSPMKITQRLRLISAPGLNGMVPRS